MIGTQRMQNMGMHMNRPSIDHRVPSWSWLLMLAAILFANTARADVALRVEARPIADPIEAFVTVTDTNGDPVPGLTAADFTVTLDGVDVPLTDITFTLPTSQDPNQKVSVVIAMDFSPSLQDAGLEDMQNAVISFINSMSPGDFAAIVKFNDSNPDRASVVQPFTEIDDGGAGDSALISAVMAPYPGSGTNILDAIDVSIDHFNSPPAPLPDGPKAVIVVTDGGENQSEVTRTEVIDSANGSSIPVFTIGVGIVEEAGLELLTDLADQTGGDYLAAPTGPEIIAAYATISLLLNNEYLLIIPSTISDCDEHTLTVTVAGQANAASTTFTRCDPDPPPPPPPPSGGGGGGAMGAIELIAGLGVLVALRRRRGAIRV